MAERITDEDNAVTAIRKLAGGNPEAINVCSMLVNEGANIDRDSVFGPFAGILLLDMAGVYEDKIWYLYKDNCKQNLEALMTVLRGYQLGLITPAQLKNAVDYMNGGTPLTPEFIKQVYTEVRQICTGFDVDNKFSL